MSWRDGIRNALESRALLLASRTLVAALLAYFIGAFLYITFARINYPFGLEWLEGAALIQVQRILSGQLLYVRPTMHYVALTYSPLYFYVSAAFASVLGLGFLPLRLVSFLSTLGCAAIIYLWINKRTGSRYASLMAAGSFAATYKIGGAWFDIARVDMLALFLALLAINLLDGRAAWQLLLAGATISLVCLTKQSYFLLVVPLLIYAFAVQGVRAWMVASAALAVSGLSTLWLDWIHRGWYSFFVFRLAFNQGQSVSAGGLWHFVEGYWNGPVLQKVPILFLFSAAYFIVHRGEVVKRLGLLVLAGGMILLSWLGIINVGGWNNVLIPSYAIFVMISWLLVHEVLTRATVSNVARSGVLLLLSAQLVLLLYPIGDNIPTADDLRAGQALIQEITQAPGDVFVPYDNYLALLANKSVFANYAAWGDLGEGRDKVARSTRREVTSDLRAAVETRRFSLILLDGRAPWDDLEPYYQRSVITYSGEAFMPATGWQVRPTYRFTPREPHQRASE